MTKSYALNNIFKAAYWPTHKELRSAKFSGHLNAMLDRLAESLGGVLVTTETDAVGMHLSLNNARIEPGSYILIKSSKYYEVWPKESFEMFAREVAAPVEQDAQVKEAIENYASVQREPSIGEEFAKLPRLFARLNASGKAHKNIEVYLPVKFFDSLLMQVSSYVDYEPRLVSNRLGAHIEEFLFANILYRRLPE